jgi:pyruvate-formate lyase-activating enzyme
VEPDERLVTVLVTLSVPDTADADDAATLIAVAADSTALPGVIQVALTALHPDQVDSPPSPPRTQRTARPPTTALTSPELRVTAAASSARTPR